jgi:flagellar biosynthesis/type III secretory pathway chaperone
MQISTIISTLEKLERLHKSLYEIAVSKTEYIKSNDIEKLDQIIKNEQAHVTGIETLESMRLQQVKAYMELQNETVQDNHYAIADLLKTLNQESSEYQALYNIREQLMEVLAKLKDVNDLNQKLLFQSLQFVNISLNMLRPQSQEQVNYSDKEVMGKQTMNKKSYFDSQA